MFFISAHIILKKLSEYIYFHILKNITSHAFSLVLTLAKAFSVSLSILEINYVTWNVILVMGKTLMNHEGSTLVKNIYGIISCWTISGQWSLSAPPKNVKNQRIFDVLKGCGKTPMAWNRLTWKFNWAQRSKSTALRRPENPLDWNW